ncbi:hypothetical protein O3P69_003379 [Scylla paramamosain]|uniref:Thyrotropin-releasing hormone receptor n=1 Tax=Scylla paramamosain TaxID=85552 RepID=A0AAW0ULW5_SCYPA
MKDVPAAQRGEARLRPVRPDRCQYVLALTVRSRSEQQQQQQQQQAIGLPSNAIPLFPAGNLVVLLVMWVHPRMRSTTNFFLTNLAIADFCVTVFCVYQNLSLYLAQT